ncbi:MAG: hypothetical protein K2J67_04170 [Lachnospiraceae bacterium]|nr:hypothetical protein [Lachnospiraceae bacterium]
MGSRRREIKWLPGSITVEASLVVPIFFLALFAFMYLFECLMQQNDLQDQIGRSAEKYAFYGVQMPYINTMDGADQWVNWNVQDGKGYCETEMQRTIPGLPSWLLQVHLYQRVQVHDYTGRSMVSEDTGNDKTYVYIAENGTVYHMRIDCTYLRLGIQTVAGSAVENMRNQSGGKYKPCESCTKGQPPANDSSVYLTPYGARYHLTKECPGLRRTVRQVSKSSVPGLPPCSKCGQ